MSLHPTQEYRPNVHGWSDVCATLQHTLQVFEHVAAFVANSPWRDEATAFEVRRVEAVARLTRAQARLPSSPHGAAPLERLLVSAGATDDDHESHAVIGSAASDGQPSTSADRDHGATSMEQPASSATFALTRREREVVILIARGLSNRQIADELVLVEGTVANHVANILRKLDCSNRAQVATWAVRRGLQLEDSLG